MALVVQCVNKESNPRDCRDIKSIGIPGKYKDVVTKKPEEMYDLIENEGRDVVVEHNGIRTDVNGVKRGTTKYVRSKPNDTKDDNLLKPPIC